MKTDIILLSNEEKRLVTSIYQQFTPIFSFKNKVCCTKPHENTHLCNSVLYEFSHATSFLKKCRQDILGKLAGISQAALFIIELYTVFLLGRYQN